jgi:hypothetical protein
VKQGDRIIDRGTATQAQRVLALARRLHPDYRRLQASHPPRPY